MQTAILLVTKIEFLQLWWDALTKYDDCWIGTLTEFQFRKMPLLTYFKYIYQSM